MLAGGAFFNNLDYSFHINSENGSDTTRNLKFGHGGPVFRQQLKVLRDFMYSIDFITMRPDKSFIISGIPETGDIQALVSRGNCYLIYFGTGHHYDLELDISVGLYRVEWIDPASGKTRW